MTTRVTLLFMRLPVVAATAVLLTLTACSATVDDEATPAPSPSPSQSSAAPTDDPDLPSSSSSLRPVYDTCKDEARQLSFATNGELQLQAVGDWRTSEVFDCVMRETFTPPQIRQQIEATDTGTEQSAVNDAGDLSYVWKMTGEVLNLIIVDVTDI